VAVVIVMALGYLGSVFLPLNLLLTILSTESPLVHIKQYPMKFNIILFCQ
jgi:hypothetical protein